MERNVCPVCGARSTFLPHGGPEDFKNVFNRRMTCCSCGTAVRYCEIRVYSDAEREQARQRKLARKRELSRLRRKANPDIDRDYYARNSDAIKTRARARYRNDPIAAATSSVKATTEGDWE